MTIHEEDLRRVREDWNHAAKHYRNQCENGANPSLKLLKPELEAALSNVGGKHVLDAGCGYGRLMKSLLDRGAFVIGADISETMLTLADEELSNNDRQKFRLLRSAISNMPEIKSSSVDQVFAINVLQDLPDLQASLVELGRVIRTRGRLSIAIEHPITTSGILRRSSQERPDHSYLSQRSFKSGFLGQDRKVWGWHRPISVYVAALKKAGFVVERLEEPAPTAQLIAEAPALRKWVHSPLFLCIEAVRPI